jgi:predicted nucleic acid-binding protein
MRDLLLDTNTLNYILKRRQPVVDRLRKASDDGCRFFLASIVHYELIRYLELKKADRLIDLYGRLVESWSRYSLSFADWSSAARLWSECHRVGRSISDLDLLLATVARKHDVVLVTSNTRHFESFGLTLEDWTL